MKTKTIHLFQFRRLVSLLMMLFVIGSKSGFSQCTPNIGFELNNLNGWQCFTGTCCPISASVLGQVAGRHDVTSGTATDIYNFSPVVCPYIGYGLHSLKLGNDGVGAEAERVRTNFVVTSGNASLIYRYAAIMENPSHAITDQPRLEFNVFDNGPSANPYTNPVLVQCPSLTFQTPSSAASLPPGWFVSPTLSPRGSPVFCSNWIPVSVNMGALVGHSVTIEFSTGDCALGGHFGYAYVDLNCGSFSIVNGYCPGSTQAVLYGPPGFANYIWDTAGTGLPIIQQGPIDSIVLTNPDSTVIYSLVLVPPNGAAGCMDTLMDTIHVQPRPSALFNFLTTACAGGFIHFYDSSLTHIPGSNIVSWSWNFGDIGSGSVNNQSTMQNPIHVFSTPGTYSVSLIVTSDISCVSDTTSQLITIVPPPPVNPDAGQPVAFCKYDSTTLQATANAAFGPYTYSWNHASTLSNASIPNPVAHPLVSTYYTVTILDPTGCSLFDSVLVTILGVHPTFNISGDDTICPGTTDQLGVVNTGLDPIPSTANYLWAPITGLSSAQIANPVASPISTITYALTINDNSCSSSRFFTVNIDNRNTLAAAIDTTYCLGNSANLYASATGPAPSGGFNYTWTPATNVANPNANPTLANPIVTTTYTVSTITYGGCILKDDMILNVGQPYTLDLLDSLTPCFNRPISIQISNLRNDIIHFYWTMDGNNGSISCTDCASATVANNAPSWVYVNTSNTLGCIVNDSIWISPIICPEIIVPSAFSPNGDGKNDYFFMLDRHFVTLTYFEVYNRWGEKVYSTTDINAKGWDGTHRGQLQDVGSYIYKIQAVDKAGEIKSKSGNVTIIR
jgi:gliding motility-associated-like protein